MKLNLDQRTADIVIRLGKQYESALLPDDIKRGPLGMCFDWNALQTARLHPKYRYVEGIASNPEDPEDWILHAWMTDGEHAFDPTWAAVNDAGVFGRVPSIYIGIEIDIHDVHRFMKLTGYQGILGNRHRAPEFWKQLKKELKNATQKTAASA